MNAGLQVFKNPESKVWSWCFFFLFFYIIETGNKCLAQQELFRAYSSKDGLVSNYPQSICQDGDGFIWIGSDDGLSIYDAYTFQNRSVENGGMSENIVSGIFRKSTDEMWVMHPNGTDVFKRRKWIKTIPVKDVNHIFYTAKGKTIGESYQGIFEIKNDSAQQIFYYDKVFDVLIESGDYLLGKDFHDSLILFDHSAKRLSGILKPGGLFKDQKNRIWLGDEERIYLLDSLALQKGIIRWSEPPFPLNQVPVGYISGFFQDSDGFYWISQLNKGIFCIDEFGNSKQFSLPNGLSSCLLIHFFEDAEGNVWAAGNGAIVKFFNKYTDLYSVDQGLASNHVSSIAWDSSAKTVWMANENGFACLYQNRIYNFAYPDNQVCTWTTILLYGDSLWAGFNGLWLYKISYKPFPKLILLNHWLPYPGKTMPENGVSDLHEYEAGKLLVNFYLDGLYTIGKNGELKKICKSALFHKFTISHDDLWSVGLDSGIAHWKMIRDAGNFFPQLIKQFDEPHDIQHISMARDSSSNIWIGTMSKGLLYFLHRGNEYDHFKNYSPQLEPAGNSIFSILVDHEGTVHIGTLTGMGTLQLNRQNITPEYQSNNYAFTHSVYDMAEGMNGDIWISGHFGLSRLRKKQTQKNVPPKVFFLRLIRNDKLDTNFNASVKSGTFSYMENNLRFDFTATSFRNEDQNLFSYKLEKGDEKKDWSVPSRNHSLSLASLPPGEYHLQVRSISADYVWSDSPAEYFFTIVPPFWATWWFFSIVAFFIFGLVALLFRFRMNQLRKVFTVRTSISRDLHDEVGSTLSGIGVMAELVTKQYGTDIPTDAKKWLQDINIHSSEMLEKMSDIVWVINPENDNLEKLVQRLKKFSDLLGRNSGVNVYFNSSPEIDSHKIDMGTRRAIFLICKEAIYNALRHSQCRNLYFSIVSVDHRLRVLVEDDGNGFASHEYSAGNGLKNMSDRAKEINAIFLVNSNPGKGTSVSVEINLP